MTQIAFALALAPDAQIACGVLARIVPGCGVAAFAAREFQPGDVLWLGGISRGKSLKNPSGTVKVSIKDHKTI